MTSTKRKTAQATTTRTGSKSAAVGITDGSKHDASKGGAVTTAGGRQTKQAVILNLLRRAEGVSIDDLTSATGWQAHSVRAALTGLRKRGHDIERNVEGGASHYRIIDKRKAVKPRRSVYLRGPLTARHAGLPEHDTQYRACSRTC